MFKPRSSNRRCLDSEPQDTWHNPEPVPMHTADGLSFHRDYLAARQAEMLAAYRARNGRIAETVELIAPAAENAG